MTIPRILVVEDDADMREMMVRFMQRNGFIALPAATEQEIRRQLASKRIDLILLDVMLGDEDGLSICASLRRDEDVPIIFVSALSADHQRMEGYGVGADDYMAKPFNPDLLVARVRAVLARTQRTPSLGYRRQVARVRFAGWTYDGKRGELTSPGGYHVALSQRETALLKVLLANAHIPLTREEIGAALDTDREDAAGSSGRAIDVLVGRLRSKIERNPRDPDLLRTERGVGYVFATDVETDSE